MINKINSLKMKKTINLLFLLSLAFVFNGCLDDDDYILYAVDEPAIVRYANDKPMLQTAAGRFYAPGLNKELIEGDYLWTSFSVNFDDQPSKTDTILSNLYYKKIGGSPAIVKGGEMTDEYTANITSSLLYFSIVENVLFFEFTQSAKEGQTIKFEMICNSDSIRNENGKTIYTFFLRSRITGNGTGSEKEIKTNYGFDMNEFIAGYKGKELIFDLKYKNKTNADGTDSYKSFQSNPITWHLY